MISPPAAPSTLKPESTRITYVIRPSVWGRVLIATTEKGVRAVFFADRSAALEEALRERCRGAEIVAGDGGREVERVLQLLASPWEKWDVPLDVRGTPFQEKVWRALLEIPAGTTASYTGIARKIGHPRAVRAVAGACAANALAVGIPCHRVVRSDGALSGYRWGAGIKRGLLAAELAALLRASKPA